MEYSGRWFFIALLGASVAGAAPPVSTPQLADFELSGLPPWADAYGEIGKRDKVYLDTDLLMKQLGFTRLQATEAQRSFRQLLGEQPDPTPRQSLFEQAVGQSSRGEFRRVNRAEIEGAKFVIVFDLDNTLYDQSLKPGNACANVHYADPRGKEVRIVTVSGLSGMIAKIKSLGGAVVLFTANDDALTERNLRAWKLDSGEDVYSSKDISAVLANAQMVFESKNSSYVVTTASKDLRYFDERLEKVLLIDDNPTRAFQQSNLRAVKKLDGDLYCENVELRNFYDGILPLVMTEVEESVRYMDAQKTTFASAYLPYSMMGRLVVDQLVESQGLTREQAIAQVRKNPSFVDRRF